MWDWLALPAIMAGAAAALLLLARWGHGKSGDPGSTILTEASPPCWEEELGTSGGFSFGRRQCVNDTLMQADARAAGGDLTGPPSHG